MNLAEIGDKKAAALADSIAAACALCIDDGGCHPKTCQLTQEQVAEALVLVHRGRTRDSFTPPT